MSSSKSFAQETMEQSDDVKVVAVTQKRKRPSDDKLKDSNIRTLKFDLSKCPEWVRTQNNSELFQIFKIGVAVKESITMNITGGKEYFDEVEQQIQETQRALETKIDGVLAPLKDCKTQLMDLASKPASKGAVGELVVLSVLEEGLPHHTVEDVSTKKEKRGDIHVTSTVSGHKHLVEVKKHKHAVSATEIEKFEDDLRESKHHTVGIFLSLDSPIQLRAKHGKFEITYEDNQYFIYVPNARKEPNLLVWSVLLADELAALDQGLTESQTQELLKLQQKFKQNMEKTKACRAKFNSLKETVNALEENLMPLLQVIDGAKSELNKALHQRGKPLSRKKAVSTLQQPGIDDFYSSTKGISTMKRPRQMMTQSDPANT
jgi:polyhydroxyalkanoate synthesis regulator phasin